MTPSGRFADLSHGRYRSCLQEVLKILQDGAEHFFLQERLDTERDLL